MYGARMDPQPHHCRLSRASMWSPTDAEPQPASCATVMRQSVLCAPLMIGISTWFFFFRKQNRSGSGAGQAGPNCPETLGPDRHLVLGYNLIGEGQNFRSPHTKAGPIGRSPPTSHTNAHDRPRYCRGRGLLGLRPGLRPDGRRPRPPPGCGTLDARQRVVPPHAGRLDGRHHGSPSRYGGRRWRRGGSCTRFPRLPAARARTRTCACCCPRLPAARGGRRAPRLPGLICDRNRSWLAASPSRAYARPPMQLSYAAC
jgi:hypothetical protein